MEVSLLTHIRQDLVMRTQVGAVLTGPLADVGKTKLFFLLFFKSSLAAGRKERDRHLLSIITVLRALICIYFNFSIKDTHTFSLVSKIQITFNLKEQ